MFIRTGKMIESEEGIHPVIRCERGIDNELSAIAAFVWESLDGKTTINQIAHEMRYFRNIANLNCMIMANQIVLELKGIGLAKSIEQEARI